MNIYQIGDSCTGCGVCALKCPTHCIEMTASSEGFLYPEINGEKCIDCGRCLKFCPANECSMDLSIKEIYAAKTKDHGNYMASASGGIASELALAILGRNGVVYGCTMDEAFHTYHIRIESPKEISRIQGSKYTQSRIDSILPELHRDVQEGREVLFTGTPCQVAAVLKHEGGRKDNLYLIDLVCHGVTNDSVLDRYISSVQNKTSASVVSYRFRDKSASMHERRESIQLEFGNGRKKKVASRVIDSPFYYGFLNNDISRLSCYGCKYKCDSRLGDITLGDYWSADSEFSAIKSDYGYSRVILNTDKGIGLFESLPDLEKYKSEKRFEIYANNRQNVPAKREKFYTFLADHSEEGQKKAWELLKADHLFARRCYAHLPYFVRKYMHRLKNMGRT